MLQDIKYSMILDVVVNTTNNEYLIWGLVILIMGIVALLVVIKSPFKGAFEVNNYTTTALGILAIILGIYYIVKYVVLLFS